MRFGRKGKLVSRFMGPFEVLEPISKVTYQLVLPMSIDCIHNMFYISLLCKYISDPTHVFSVENVKLEDNLVYEELLVQILDRRVKEFIPKQIPLVKVL